ncbi:MAG: phosphate/phosphite/phosphonate ABC transporter substrate-binding protein [Myxococcota bacterium]|nr:phosphate/phosphite/phosphonate ABC transporter substrate-binding protein [Myxococcota bacterium]
MVLRAPVLSWAAPALATFVLACWPFGCDANKGSGTPAPAASSRGHWARDGSVERPLEVMLIPADGGTEDGTKSDFMPLFNAIGKTEGLHFDVRVGQSYGAVVEGMANGQIDVGFFGAVSYLQAKKRAGAELLAVSVENGSSTYYAGIFVKDGAPMRSLADLKGKTLAVGDPGSTSSFAFPIAMLIEAGIDPIKDIAKVVFAGSHVNSLAACAEGRVDAGAASFLSLEKAVTEKKIAPDALRALGKSDPIPGPPLAMHPGLDPEVKRKLREGFATVHKAPGITPDQVRGYGGKKVDRYDVDYPDAEFMKAAQKLEKVEALKDAILKKAG